MAQQIECLWRDGVLFGKPGQVQWHRIWAGGWIRGMTFLLMLILAGCGQSGPARYEIRGTVTYGGKPVPAGQVIFEPDSEKGNPGPPAYARIQDGQYRTEPGKGVLGGPYVVRIIGTTGQPTPEMPQGQMLFPEYRLKLDLPRTNAVQNLEVPLNPSSFRPSAPASR